MEASVQTKQREALQYSAASELSRPALLSGRVAAPLARLLRCSPAFAAPLAISFPASHISLPLVCFALSRCATLLSPLPVLLLPVAAAPTAHAVVTCLVFVPFLHVVPRPLLGARTHDRTRRVPLSFSPFSYIPFSSFPSPSKPSCFAVVLPSQVSKAGQFSRRRTTRGSLAKHSRNKSGLR